MRTTRLLASVLLLLPAAACSDSTQPAEAHVFEVRVGDQENFRIALTDPVRIAEADAMLAASTSRTVIGRVRRGSGGHNAPYSWHLEPATVEFVDSTIEACSGRPMSDVEADVAYWADVMQYYCPWAAEIVARITPLE